MNRKNDEITYLEQLTYSRFAFLKTNGFSKRTLIRKLGKTYTDIIYRGASLGIVIRLQYFYRFIDVKLVKLSNGQYPKSQDIAIGERFRSRLEFVLAELLNVQDETLQAILRLRKESDYSQRDFDFLDHLMEMYQYLLNMYLPLILQQPQPILFPVPTSDTSMEYMRVELEANVVKYLEFLQTKKGFIEKEIQNKDARFTRIVYKNKSKCLGVEVQIDFLEKYIGINLIRLSSEGAILEKPLYGVDFNSLEKILQGTLHINDNTLIDMSRIRCNTEADDRDYIHGLEIINMYCELMKNYIDVILKEPLSVLLH